MTAVLLIDQAGLPVGASGFARTDGLSTGALVTIQSVGVATMHEARILTLPETDTAAIVSFTQVNTTTWTFAASIGVDGMYRIELVTDRGLPSEDKMVRIFGIRDGNGFLFPSFGLTADPNANRPDLSDAQKLLAFIQANELNEPRAGFPNGYPFGYQAELDAILRAGASGGGGGDPNLLWAWNGVDLSQFRIGGTPELDTTGGAVLSLGSHHDQVNLRFTGGGAFGFAQWVIDPAEFPSGIPFRYIVEVTYDEFDNGAGSKTPNVECGFSHFCRYNSPGNVRAYSLAQSGQGNSFLQIWTRDTTFANAGSTMSGLSAGASADRGTSHKQVVVQVRSTPFDMFYSGRYLGNSGVFDQGAGGANLDFDSGAYNGLIPNTFGVAYRDNVGQSSWAAISMIRVLKHPADVVG